MEIGPVSTASRDFRRARRKADLGEVLARLTGKPASLLSFDEISRRLNVEETGKRSLQEIPLDTIVGSVGRYKDFTRKFLPRFESDKERWARVKMSVDSMGLQPIDVYQVGQVYFVLDGHHRVSVARQIGAQTILANVIEVHSKVPLTPDDQLDDLIIKAEYANFLENTHLDQLHPEADIKVTAPGRYQLIEKQIRVCGSIMGQKQDPEIAFEEAVTRWYDEVYTPVVRVIRERGILREFPGRTEADLYLWISKHRQMLEDELGWRIDSETASADLVDQFSSKLERVISRVSERLLDVLLPDKLEAGPPPGHWRQQRVAKRQVDRLFTNILVAINGGDTGWCALEQALVIARRENTLVSGLHVVSSKDTLKSQAAQTLRVEFSQRCEAAGVTGELAFAFGRTPRKVCDRARWVDLVVLMINYPPAPQPISRLSSGLSTILRRCPRPLLAVPGTTTKLHRLLLAYDGSPKAEEALFVAAYMSAYWNSALVVLNIQEPGHNSNQVLTRARKYLENQGSQAIYSRRKGSVAEEILRATEEYDCDLIIMGGYGFNPVMEIVLGSAVDEVLRTSRKPLLICR
jgi:nucleotide-binding universal stress UspA family protein